MRGNIFNRVSSVHPARSVFDLSYSKKLTCDMGELIPVLCEEVVPGDIFKIGNQCVIRFQPLVAPILHEINVYTHYFFVPNRIVWDDWETFITGDFDGEDETALPTWEPTDTAANSLWDYLGFPVGVDPDGAYPVAFPMYAYNKVFNDFYRDETLQTEVALDAEDILVRNWAKDYFTSALPWQQRGIAPALPLSGTTNAVWPAVIAANNSNMTMNDAAFVPFAAATKATLENNTIDFADATTFDIADLRLAFQIQKFMERNARAGVRYTEFLKAHFGVAPRDDRLDRPEYIGGTKNSVIISEVLQTSETNATPQGNLVGHGISVNSSYAGTYRVQEFGVIIGIMSVMPVPVYQQGIPRQWLKETRYDYYFPEFANLSEQAVIQAELFADGVPANNQTIFGYQGRFDEMRVKQNMVVAGMRDTFDYWHLSRQFVAAPTLNEAFIQCVPRKDCFADTETHGLIVDFGNLIKAYRPMPISAEPGLIDHV